MSVRWFCNHCNYIYNEKKKICHNCHSMLSYECLSSNQKGRYNNYLRHIQSCTDCYSIYTPQHQFHEKKIEDDIPMEIENIDQGKKKTSCGHFSI
jgi:hypothetical protein